MYDDHRGKQISLTIAEDAALSAASDDFDWRTVVGFLIPADWTAAKLSLQGSLDATGSVFARVNDIANGAGEWATDTITIASSTPVWQPIDCNILTGLRRIKVQSGIEGTTVPQTGGDKTVIMVCRPVD